MRFFNTEIFHQQLPKAKDSSRHWEICSCFQAKPIQAQISRRSPWSSLLPSWKFLDSLPRNLFHLHFIKIHFYHITTFQEDMQCHREINRANLFCIIKVLKWWRYEIPISFLFPVHHRVEGLLRLIEACYIFLLLMWILAEVECNISSMKGDYFYKLNQCILLSSISRNVTLLHFII